jgi:MFS superfamily sulfate permease-like transporter
MAGVLTAVVGGLVTPWISNSALTIKGPAAGLIVIALGAVTELGSVYKVGPFEAYRLALGVGVAAGVLQIVFALTRSGVLGDFFPTSVVHGMLAAIGVIIISKQIHITLGVTDAKGSPLELLAQIPSSIRRLNPEIALIGLTSLAILFGLPLIRNRYIRRIPGPMLVLLVAVPLSLYFNLAQEHTYTLGGQEYPLSDKFLVSIPSNMFAAITAPRFEALATWAGWKWVMLFALIGSVESLLSAKAVDLIDPWKRKTNMNRDLLAIGIGNTLAASVGGLPMISEIVRSKANADSGARTRFANMFHGLFLLFFVSLLPGLIHRIPLAALSAMLVYTGTRLASPREFQNVFRIGREQFLIFVSTMVGVLATDLLIGVLIGIAVKFAIHILNGVPLRSLFKPFLAIESLPDGRQLIRASGSAVFSNWIPFKRQIEQVGLTQRNSLVIDLSEARVVDHSVMEKLHELQEDFEVEGLSLELVGLESHRKLSDHAMSARKRGLRRIHRLTIVTETTHADRLIEELDRREIGVVTVTDCRSRPSAASTGRLVRIEVLVPLEKYESLLAHVQQEARVHGSMTVCAETVEIIRGDWL